MDKLKVQERFESGEIDEQEWPGWFRRLVLWIEKDIFFKVSKRTNWLQDRIGNDSDFEIIKDGSDKGDDGNWRLRISGDDLVIEKRVSSSWVETSKIHGS